MYFAPLHSAAREADLARMRKSARHYASMERITRQLLERACAAMLELAKPLKWIDRLAGKVEVEKKTITFRRRFPLVFTSHQDITTGPKVWNVYSVAPLPETVNHYPLANGEMLATTLRGSDVQKVINFLNGGDLDLVIVKEGALCAN